MTDFGLSQLSPYSYSIIAGFFDIDPWHVNNAETSALATLFVGFINQWTMALFFVLAGASTFFALRTRTARSYIRERFLRLLLPLVVLGWFILAPPQVYLEKLTQSQFTGSFFQFYANYFNGFYMDIGSQGNFAWHGMHLCFHCRFSCPIRRQERALL